MTANSDKQQFYCSKCIILPMHSTVPSPVYPTSHVQKKDPGVLVQAALLVQLLSSSRAHSSKSVASIKNVSH